MGVAPRPWHPQGVSLHLTIIASVGSVAPRQWHPQGVPLHLTIIASIRPQVAPGTRKGCHYI